MNSTSKKSAIKTLSILWSFFLCTSAFYAQQSENGNAYVDRKGVLRWEKTKEEIKGFGVNYSVPFAHAYRTAKRNGIDIKKAIDNDVYHFTRLGFDLYRLHVWDTEISDEKGNLLVNEHLQTFDYLLYKLKQSGINCIITPIAFWGNGWPEPDTKTPGFSSKYGKGNSLYNPDAIVAQQRYLFQFLNHVNPYTGVAYKDEPNIIAFEVSNEPHHRGDPKKVTAFVKGMVKAMKKTGTQKPIFYNISHGVHFADNYFKGGIDGGTFQWYPTGLGYQRELPGNALPNVNAYTIPFDGIINKHRGAKIVYEFDAADIGKSYIYPAMGRSFRKAGIQLATHFAYDPTYMAHTNTEYNTHFMNLAYTPQKALSLKITSKVFHELPRYVSYGAYPKNTSFGNTKVAYEKDLALYNSPTAYYYTNTTEIAPNDVSKLKEVAGYGTSPVVSYSGSGAYFLDRLDDGVWRLEVLPDAFWVDNPFGRNSPKKTVAVIQWNTHTMSIDIPELGSAFSVKALNSGNTYNTNAEEQSFKIQPGTYLISAQNNNNTYTASESFGKGLLGDFFAPESNVDRVWFRHQPPSEATEGKPLDLSVHLVSPAPVSSVKAVGFVGNKRFTLPLQLDKHDLYTGTLSDSIVQKGYLSYHVLVTTSDGTVTTYPAGKKGLPWDWDFYERTPYKIPVVSSETPIALFDALSESHLLIRTWKPGMQLIPTHKPQEATYQMPIGKLFTKDPENENAPAIYDYSFKHSIIDKVQTRHHDITHKKRIALYGKSLEESTDTIQIAFVMKNGAAYGGLLTVSDTLTTSYLDLDSLQPVKTVTLPRPYPSFLPYYFEHNNKESFSILEVESIQISIGPGLSEERKKKTHGLSLSKIWLE